MTAHQRTPRRRVTERTFAPQSHHAAQPAGTGEGAPQNDGGLLAGGTGAPQNDGGLLAGGAGAPQNDGGLLAGGTEGNERLTSATGILLILLLAALGITILRIGPLISEHLFIGLLLIPPIALKLASTGYRFMRYYTSDPVYRERGAPPTAMRLTAPLVVLTSVAVFATGVALLALGPDASGTLRGLHKASFIAWIAVTSLHVLGHLPDIQKTFLTKNGGHLEYNSLAAGRAGRTIALAGALLAGVVLAIVLIPHFGSWSHFEAFRHHH